MDASGPLSLPPAATPSSPLDNDQAPPYWSSNQGFYAPLTHAQSAPVNAHIRNGSIHSNRGRHNHNVSNDEAAETTSIASSTLPPPYQPQTRRYGVHKSEDEYLAALRAWAEEKQWVEVNGSGALNGFYGDECLEDRSRRMKAERQGEKEAKARAKAMRRATVDAGSSATGLKGRAQRRKSSVAGWWERRKNGGV